jgi:hypothetical protein
MGGSVFGEAKPMVDADVQYDHRFAAQTRCHPDM